MIRHLCSYCGGYDAESHENGWSYAMVVNQLPTLGDSNDLLRVLCAHCYTKVFDRVLGPPQFRYKNDGTKWVREPWLREVQESNDS